jgi:Ca-activated chloride channel family protein
MDVAMAGPKTALGDAIGLAIRTFQESDVDVRMLILLTDGNDTASRMTPVNAAEIAASQGLEIHTIGIGDRAATGEDRVDFDALESIAQRTGGQFFNAEDEAGLIEIYERIDEFAPGEIKTRSWRPRQSLVHWPAGAAAVIGLVGTLLMLWFSSRRQSA